MRWRLKVAATTYVLLRKLGWNVFLATIFAGIALIKRYPS